jgi:2-polyprenyl-3-methyl-5-hydroxy-6-metoxy-1,4-benzoquinol methylase
MIQNCVVHAEHHQPRRSFVKRDVDIYECPTCGCIMADLEFVHEQYESDSYYTIASRNKDDIEAHWGFRWRHILRSLLRYVDKPRLMDVGAGNGYFVYLARKEFGLQADGLEISDAESAYAREMFGIDFIRSELAHVEGRYDALTSFNVIEHVPNPAALLAGMRERLNDGGYLIVTTPNPSCIHRRILGLQKWNMVAPPHHINLFTRVALEEMLEHAGFEVLEYSTISTYINFVRSFDTKCLLFRRAVFHALKGANLGADHFFICRIKKTQ